MDLDSTLCFCFHIRKRKIVNFVKQTRPRRASQISDCFGAGTGCGWCIPFLKQIHRQIVAGDIVEAGDISAAEYETMRLEYLRGIREGERRPHGAETTELPVGPGGPPGPGEPEGVRDVSEYFSRRSRPGGEGRRGGGRGPAKAAGGPGSGPDASHADLPDRDPEPDQNSSDGPR